jgi:hypothetical protein
LHIFLIKQIVNFEIEKSQTTCNLERAAHHVEDGTT